MKQTTQGARTENSDRAMVAVSQTKKIGDSLGSRKKSILFGWFKIGGFFFAVMITAFALNSAINHGLRKIKTSKFGSFNKLVSGQINTDIVISGSSRALCHYDPALIRQITAKKLGL